MFGEDASAKFFNKDNGKPVSRDYSPNIMTTVVKSPTKLLKGWHDTWDKDTREVFDKYPDDAELLEQLPRYSDLPKEVLVP